MEITRATVEATADLDFENFEDYRNEPDNFFLETNWYITQPMSLHQKATVFNTNRQTILSNLSVISTTWLTSLRMIWKTISPNANRKVNP